MGAALGWNLYRVQPADDRGEASVFWHVAGYVVRAGCLSHICILTFGSQPRLWFRFSCMRRFEVALGR